MDPSDDDGLVIQDAADCLRVNVIEGAELSKTLHLYQRQINFLTAIEEVQMAQFQRKDIDAQSARLALYYCDSYLAPDVFSRINLYNLWLFAMTWGTQEQQQAYYRKVWRLCRHINDHILLIPLGLLMMLRLVTINSSTLQVTILLQGEDGTFYWLLLNEGGNKRSIYSLSRIAAPTTDNSRRALPASVCHHSLSKPLHTNRNHLAHCSDQHILREPSPRSQFSRSSQPTGLKFEPFSELHSVLVSCRSKP